MKKIKFIIIAIILLTTCSLFSQDIGDIMIPFSPHTDNWDHRWYAELPKCENYKSIEILSFDNELFQNSLYVLVKLNLIDEEKQDLYFNNVHKAKGWRNEAKFAKMIYKTNGKHGSPMDLDLSFTDNNGDKVNVQFNCVNSEPGSDGYANVTKFELKEVMSLVAYEMHCLPSSVSVQIGGYKLEYDSEKDSNSTSIIKPMYSFNNLSCTFKADDVFIFCNDSTVGNEYGMSFDIENTDNGKILRTKKIGYKKYIEIITDNLNQMKDYTFYNADKYFRIGFSQPFISTKTPDYEQNEKKIFIKNKFSITVSNTKQLIKGEISSELNPGFIHTEWSFTDPKWISKYKFMTDMLQISDDGYKLRILPLPDKE